LHQKCALKHFELTADNADRAAALMFEQPDQIQAELMKKKKDVSKKHEKRIIEIQEIANKLDNL